jgi:hypothetical protein
MTSMKWITPLLWGATAVFCHGQQFQDQTLTRLPPQNIWSEEVDAGDVDGDGDLDLYYAKGNGFGSAGTARQNTLLINDGAGVFTDETATRLPVFLDNSKDGDFVDVDGDGDLDIVVANCFGQQPRLYLNGGTGVFTDATVTHLPAGNLNCMSSAAGDVDADGDLDLAFMDNGGTSFPGSGGQTRIYVNDGTGHFVNETATRMPVSLIAGGVDVNFFDVDGDMDLDLVAVSRDQSPSKLYKNNGAGVFVEATLPSDGSQTYEYEIGDVDGDLDADIFVISINGFNEGTFLNNGTGTFTAGVGTVVGNLSGDDNDAALGDIDNDGDFDCIVAALQTSERVFTNNGAGVFTYNSSLITSLLDSSLDGEFADVDNDDDLDYVTAVGESGAFQNRIFINTSLTAADTQAPLFRLPPLGSTTVFGDIAVRFGVKDVMATDGDPEYQSTVLNWTVNAVPGSAPMTWVGGDAFQATIPSVPFGAAVVVWADCTDRAGNAATSANVSFSAMGYPPVEFTVTTTGVGDVTMTINAPGQSFVQEYLLASVLTLGAIGSGPFLGLGPDAFAFLSLPAGLPPFHDFLDANGMMSVAYGPGTLPVGITYDARVLTLPPASLPQLSPIVRQTF